MIENISSIYIVVIFKISPIEVLSPFVKKQNTLKSSKTPHTLSSIFEKVDLLKEWFWRDIIFVNLIRFNELIKNFFLQMNIT